jgi:hypothetical protein
MKMCCFNQADVQKQKLCFAIIFAQLETSLGQHAVLTAPAQEITNPWQGKINMQTAPARKHEPLSEHVRRTSLKEKNKNNNCYLHISA